MKTKNAIILTLILCAVVGTMWYTLGDSKVFDTAQGEGNRMNCDGEVAPEIGYCAPNFTLPTLDGKKKVELYENQGKPTLVNFWASWCEPCKKEMPFIEKAYQKYNNQVNFLMVNETGQDRLENVQSYVKQNRFTFPILLDRFDTNQKNVGSDKYHAFGIPMTFVIDEEGEITHKITGAMTEKQLQQILDKMTD